jgi:hypothetical protein
VHPVLARSWPQFGINGLDWLNLTFGTPGGTESTVPNCKLQSLHF